MGENQRRALNFQRRVYLIVTAMNVHISQFHLYASSNTILTDDNIFSRVIWLRQKA